jgi:hypothetical protein
MKASLATGTTKRLDRPTAWGCLVTNVATLPGLGSLAAGRRVGYAQATVALVGFGLSLTWMLLFVRDWWTEGALPIGWRPSLRVGIAGIGVYGTAWLWAFGTSLSLLSASESSVPRSVNDYPPSPLPADRKPPAEADPSRPPRL